jgi:hypothetical protein
MRTNYRPRFGQIQIGRLTRRCSEREPAVSARANLHVVGGWLRSLTFVVMRASRLILGVIAAAVIVLLVALVYRVGAGPRPPVLTLVSVEPSGMFDDTGAEMSMVTFRADP